METTKEQNKNCEYSNYCKDNNKNIYFICDYCGKEMDMNEVRECSFFNISSNNDIELREEWYEYLRSIIKNRDYIPEDAIDGAGDWWLSKIDELLKSQREELVEKIEMLPSYWRHEFKLFPRDYTSKDELAEMKKLDDIINLLSNLSPNKENKNNE